MSPDLRLRLHATQAQPCFPAASNALALPGGNGIFTATPAERITHYTLLRKVVCQMGALPPLETPTRKGGTLPLHGAHTAFSCYPALRLYRLSKSPRGIDVVSLTLGNSALPLGDGLGRDVYAPGQRLLRQALRAARGCDQRAGLSPVQRTTSSFEYSGAAPKRQPTAGRLARRPVCWKAPGRPPAGGAATAAYAGAVRSAGDRPRPSPAAATRAR